MGPDNGSEIWVKLEGNNPAGSVKDRAALSMIVRAESAAKIRRAIEATSGNTGTVSPAATPVSRHDCGAERLSHEAADAG